MNVRAQAIADTIAIFPALVTGAVQVLIAGEIAFSVDVIDNSLNSRQQILGVGLVSAEPHIVLLTTNAANIPATATIRLNAVDWQIYGDPIDHRTGLTTLNLIRP